MENDHIKYVANIKSRKKYVVNRRVVIPLPGTACALAADGARPVR